VAGGGGRVARFFATPCLFAIHTQGYLLCWSQVHRGTHTNGSWRLNDGRVAGGLPAVFFRPSQTRRASPPATQTWSPTTRHAHHFRRTDWRGPRRTGCGARIGDSARRMVSARPSGRGWPRSSSSACAKPQAVAHAKTQAASGRFHHAAGGRAVLGTGYPVLDHSRHSPAFQTCALRLFDDGRQVGRKQPSLMHGEHVAALLMDDQYATCLDGGGCSAGTINVSAESRPSGVRIRNSFWLAIHGSIPHCRRRLQSPIALGSISPPFRGDGLRNGAVPTRLECLAGCVSGTLLRADRNVCPTCRTVVAPCHPHTPIGIDLGTTFSAARGWSRRATRP